MCRVFRRAAFVLVVAAVAAGCGGDDSKFSDGKVADELGLQHKGGGYQVGANPFCRIDGILNDASETADLSGRERRLAITSRRGNVGVVVATPFAPKCKREVIAGLNALDREPKDQG